MDVNKMIFIQTHQVAAPSRVWLKKLSRMSQTLPLPKSFGEDPYFAFIELLT